MNKTKNEPTPLKQTIDKYAKTVFKPGLGKLEGITANLKCRPDSQPKFCKPRPVPFALKPRVDEALDRMVADDNLERVDYSDWDTPIVPVVKPDGTIRGS